MSEPAAEEYTIGWICALQEELEAAYRMLDDEFDALEAANPNDDNTYVFGRIHNHNVVIGCLPPGINGTTSAACVARDMVRSFPNLRFALMVGIGGGAPTPENDIRLGDVVVSVPKGELGGVLQYDLGKRLSDGEFKRTGQLNAPSRVLLSALPKVRLHHNDPGANDSIAENLARMGHWPKYSRPSVDKLYRVDSRHQIGKTCDGCDPNGLIERPPRRSDREIMVHYGTIASGNTVMKDAAERDRYAKDPALNVLCFEMEAAGLMNNFPCLVIRGICDYSDDHKNDEWHNYSALTAAAYARDLLGIVRPQKVASQPAWAGKIESLLGEFCEGVKEVVHHQRSEEEETLLRWLSPIDHVKTQIDKSRCRRPETRAGQWLFESQEFKEFLSENNKNLFCPGIPGAGKTVLASVVVEYLLNLRKTGDGNERSRIGVAFIYFDFKQQSELVHFLGSILRQLATDDSSAFDSIRKAHKECEEKCRALSISEVRELLHSMASNFSRLFIVVDALDEGRQHVCDGLLSEMFDLQRSCVTNVFATSRHIPAIEARFKGASTLEIRACDEDVRKYVDDNTDKLLALSKRTQGYERKSKKALSTLSTECRFLLAKFHLDSLIGVRSVRALRDALNRLPSPAGTNAYDQAYDLALDRIEGQIPNTRDFAIKVLSWVACTRVHLTIKELQYALAVIVGSTHFDESNIPDMRDVVLVCAGLVVIDEERQIVRLVHYTAQEYFERHQKQRLPDAQSYITTICLAYLSLDCFQDVSWSSDRFLLQQHPFYRYDAMNWGYHARETPALLPAILEFLQSERKIEGVGWVMAESVWGYTPRLPRVTGLHIAAFFGILEAVKLLMNHDCADSKDGHDWSPLSWAAFNGQYDVVAQLLDKGKVDAESRDSWSKTPLHLAAQNGHSEVMKLLLIEGHVDVNARDVGGTTPLHLAAEKGHSVVPTLLDYGADSNAFDDKLRKPITLAVMGDHITAMRQLLDKNKVGLDSLDEHGHGPLLADAASAGSMGAVKVLIDEYKVDINSKDLYGRTPLSNALLKGHKDVANSLLSYDRVDLISPDFDGRTPLFHATEADNVAAVEFLLIQDGVDINLKNNRGYSALSEAAQGAHLATARLLIENGADIDSKDDHGRTPLLEAAFRHHLTSIELLRINGLLLEQQRSCCLDIGIVPYPSRQRREEYSDTLRKSKDICDLLVEKGADLGVEDDHGNTIESYRKMELEFRASSGVQDPNEPCRHCGSWGVFCPFEMGGKGDVVEVYFLDFHRPTSTFS